MELRVPVIGVTGEHGSGKSLFATTIRPESTFLVDLEESSVSYNLPIAKRINGYQELAKISKGKFPKPIEAFEWFRDLILSVEPGEYQVGVVDPITDIEGGMVAYIEQNPKEFGYTRNQFDRAPGLLWAAVNSYWKMFQGLLTAKFETFVFITHMRFAWKSGRPTAAREAKGKAALVEIASLYLKLERELDTKGAIPRIPVGVITPHPYKSRLMATVVDERLGTTNHLPILPPSIRDCTPDRIRWYIANPPDYSNLKNHERVPKKEMTEKERLELEVRISEARAETATLNAKKSANMEDSAREVAEERAKREGKSTKSQTSVPEDVAKKTDEKTSGPAPVAGTTSVGEIETSIRKLMKKHGYNKAKAVEVIGSFQDGASRLSDMNLDSLQKLEGFLSDTVAMKEAVGN